MSEATRPLDPTDVGAPPVGRAASQAQVHESAGEASDRAAKEGDAAVDSTTPSEAEAALARLRGEIERVDAALVALIAERVRLAGQVGDAKRALGRSTLDPVREAAVVRRAGALARDAGLDEEAVRAVFWQLMALARRTQDGDAPP